MVRQTYRKLFEETAALAVSEKISLDELIIDGCYHEGIRVLHSVNGPTCQENQLRGKGAESYRHLKISWFELLEDGWDFCPLCIFHLKHENRSTLFNVMDALDSVEAASKLAKSVLYLGSQASLEDLHELEKSLIIALSRPLQCAPPNPLEPVFSNKLENIRAFFNWKLSPSELALAVRYAKLHLHPALNVEDKGGPVELPSSPGSWTLFYRRPDPNRHPMEAASLEDVYDGLRGALKTVKIPYSLGFPIFLSQILMAQNTSRSRSFFWLPGSIELWSEVFTSSILATEISGPLSDKEAETLDALPRNTLKDPQGLFDLYLTAYNLESW